MSLARKEVPAAREGTGLRVAASPGRRAETEYSVDVARLVRLTSMVRSLRTEAQRVDLDGDAFHRLVEIHARALDHLREILSSDLHAELDDLQGTSSAGAPSSLPELRVVQAQLVGWLEGVFHGLRISLLTEQLVSQQELAHAYARSLEEAGLGNGDEDRSPYL